MTTHRLLEKVRTLLVNFLFFLISFIAVYILGGLSKLYYEFFMQGWNTTVIKFN